MSGPYICVKSSLAGEAEYVSITDMAARIAELERQLASIERKHNMDAYEGFHQRRYPDYNGWILFEVFSKRGSWFYSAVDRCCGHVGYSEGPFNTAEDAYRDAIKEIGCSDRDETRNDNGTQRDMEDMDSD